MSQQTFSSEAAKILSWRRSPLKFVDECLHVKPDEWQKDFLSLLADPDKQRIGMKACKGPGKTGSLAWAIWWFMLCMGEPNNHPKGAAVSITEDNLKDNLWPELAKWQGVSPLLRDHFIWTKSRIYSKDFPETWFFSARSWSKDANREQMGATLAGFHSKSVMFVLDETGAMPIAILDAAEGGMTGSDGWSKILQAGNPTNFEGYALYEAWKNRAHLWHFIEINGDPDYPKRSPRISLDWAKEQIRLYGRDNPWVMASILGKFPPSGINSLIAPDLVHVAMRKQLRKDEYEYVQKRIGIDVARFGDDRTILLPRQGLAAFKPVEMRNSRTNEIAARVTEAHVRWGSEMHFVDGTGGFGGGVVDSLMMAGVPVTEVQFAGKANDARFVNKRAEMWWNMAEWLKRGAALPNMPELVRELSAPTFTFANGKFQLESKDQIKKRLGYSPDIADALALTFFIPDMPSNGRGLRKSAMSEHDWNPYSPDRLGQEQVQDA